MVLASKAHSNDCLPHYPINFFYYANYILLESLWYISMYILIYLPCCALSGRFLCYSAHRYFEVYVLLCSKCLCDVQETEYHEHMRLLETASKAFLPSISFGDCLIAERLSL